MTYENPIPLVPRNADTLLEADLLQLVGRNVAHGVIITDPEGRVRWINDETERLTGYTLDEFFGRKPGELLQGDRTDSQSIELMREAIRNRHPFEVTVANYTKHGLLYWVHVSARPFVDDAGNLAGYISTQVDVTWLRRLSEFNALLTSVNQAIALAIDDIAFMEAICELAVRHASVELAWVGRPNEKKEIVFLACAGRATKYLDGIRISVDPEIPEGQGPSGMTWRDKTARYSQSFSSFASLKPWQQRARKFGLDASAMIPIFRGGDIWAVLTVYHARSGIFDDELCRLLDTLARDISHGLDQIDTRIREGALTDQLHREKELAQVTLASIGEGVITTDVQGLVVFANRKARELCGLGEAVATGQPLRTIFQIQQGESSKGRVDDPVEEVLHTRAPVDFGNDTLLKGLDGQDRNVESSAAPIFSKEGELQGCVFIFRDVTERYQANKELDWRANHDALTGLPNRFALEKKLNESIERARIGNHSLAVGMLDLDDFKPVNDRYGHAVGDLLLKELARRIRSQIRDGDFVARLAGDEMVVVIDNLNLCKDAETLDQVLARLHRAVETTFEVGVDESVMLKMSMGVAVYPRDGEDADGLLRQADAAMYGVKSRKYSRTQWWQPAALSLSEQAKESAIDPYGPVAHDLLTQVCSLWQDLDAEFVDAFYERLHRNSNAGHVLALLTPSELAQLRQRQAEQLKKLTSAKLTIEEHKRIAVHLGEVHAMVGVEATDMMAAMDDYGRLLRYSVQKLPWRVDTRLALESVLQSRLALQIQFESEGRNKIQHARVESITGLDELLQNWQGDGDLAPRLVEHLSIMPCVGLAVIGRPDEQDHFIVEFSAGKLANRRKSSFQEELGKVGLDSSQGAAWRNAWISGHIVLLEQLSSGKSGKPIRDMEMFSMRSAAYIPIVDAQGRSVLLIAIFGTYPAQFSHAAMRMWLESIQHMTTPAFLRIEKVGGLPIEVATRNHYHELLFSGRLQMLVQPVIELATGNVTKVEALARLQDGTQLLGPEKFLPSFGTQDLQALFRKGLHQILGWLAGWVRNGLTLGVGLNLPPSVLISSDCANWVEEALALHGIAPNLLYLELLENEDDSWRADERNAAIARLAELGIHLVMDDLGAGYASLQRMRTLPFQSVKIDQGLVQAATREPSRTLPFIGLLIEMAQCLGLEVVVEGLECDELIDMARQFGAEYGQGYGLAKPMSPGDLPGWIDDWKARMPLQNLGTTFGDLAASFRRPRAVNTR